MIGIPFYLARADLGQIEKENNDLESDREVMMYLRHEAGHAFNYAYRLHRTPEWKQLFGPYRRPYRENYRPVLFSKDYVRYLPGWYAQKHPDEDFAETFAVWMTPRSGWRKKYRGWGAMAKLQYMDRIARELGQADPQRKRGSPDITVADMEMTVAEFYRNSTEQIPIPYAFRKARFTARVSAIRSSAPRTCAETLVGSASPYPTKPLQAGDL